MMTTEFSPEQRAALKGWLKDAYQAASRFDGSEPAADALLAPLEEIDEAIRRQNGGRSSEIIEEALAAELLPQARTPFTISALLGDTARRFYQSLKEQDPQNVLEMLERGGAVIKQTGRTFVKTDDRQLLNGNGSSEHAYEVRTQPRLAILMERLQSIGVHSDDVVIHAGTVDPTMMRQHPYMLVQIPKLDAEIGVCDQIGEVTFISDKILGPTLWASLSKDELKSRPEIAAVKFTDEDRWWGDLSGALQQKEIHAGLKAKTFANKAEPLDVDLIKASILAHRMGTGKWTVMSVKGSDGKRVIPVVEYGPYAGQTTWSSLDSALSKGTRGLSGGSSLPRLYKEVSDEHGLDYKNIHAQEDLNIADIKASILLHRLEAGKWPVRHVKGADGKLIHPLMEHGPYAGQTTWANLDTVLRYSLRGLVGGVTLMQLCQEVSDEHGLDYKNIHAQEDFNIADIKASILAHRLEKGAWPVKVVKGPDGKQISAMVEYGPYAGQTTWSNLNAALRGGGRGLLGGSSVTQLCQEVSDEHGLDYKNHLAQDDLRIDDIKASILAHRIETGKWPVTAVKEPDGKRVSPMVQYGHYAGKMTWSSLDQALNRGVRGLPGGSSVTQLCQEVSDEHGLDYKNHLAQDDLTIDDIKASIVAHRMETGKWPVRQVKGADGKRTYPMVEYGPYAGQATWNSLSLASCRGSRGLPRGLSLAQLCQEISDKHDLDYKNNMAMEDWSIDDIKASILAHRMETGKWPVTAVKEPDGKWISPMMEYGPYAGQTTWSNLNRALRDGQRGLPGGSSLAQFCKEVSDQHGLDYKNNMVMNDLSIDDIKASILAHRMETGIWPVRVVKGPDGKWISPMVEHGPYAGQIGWPNLDRALREGGRGLPGGSSLAQLKQELKDEWDMGADGIYLPQPSLDLHAPQA